MSPCSDSDPQQQSLLRQLVLHMNQLNPHTLPPAPFSLTFQYIYEPLPPPNSPISQILYIFFPDLLVPAAPPNVFEHRVKYWKFSNPRHHCFTAAPQLQTERLKTSCASFYTQHFFFFFSPVVLTSKSQLEFEIFNLVRERRALVKRQQKVWIHGVAKKWVYC